MSATRPRRPPLDAEQSAMITATMTPDHAPVELAHAVRSLGAEAHRLLRHDQAPPRRLVELMRRIDAFRLRVPGGPSGDLGRWLECVRGRLADRLRETGTPAVV